METHYRTLTGRRFDLAQLSADERGFLGEVADLYRRRPDWNEFARTWMSLARERLWAGRKVPVGAPVYRICQDMEARLGIAEGRVASPDYRDRIADLIEERYGSRYAFCQATGIDQGNLSKVLAARSRHLSPETLFKAIEHLGVEIELVGKSELVDHALDPFRADSPSERLSILEHHIATLRNLGAMAKGCPAGRKASLLPPAGLFPDGLEEVRARVSAGEDFDRVVDRALADALDQRAALTEDLAASAAEEREAHRKAAG